MADVERLLIVGGGIAGLSLGGALHRQGRSVEIVERSPNWRADGGGILVQANGMRSAPVCRAIDDRSEALQR